MHLFPLLSNTKGNYTQTDDSPVGIHSINATNVQSRSTTGSTASDMTIFGKSSYPRKNCPWCPICIQSTEWSVLRKQRRSVTHHWSTTSRYLLPLMIAADRVWQTSPRFWPSGIWGLLVLDRLGAEVCSQGQQVHGH